MNPSVTSKQELLKAAREIAETQGVAHISVRALAAKCKISVGAIYNYFPTKADLVVAVIEDFWRGAFHGKSWTQAEQECFPVFWGRVYDRFYAYLQTFQVNWMEQLGGLTLSEKEKAKNMETHYFLHMKEGFVLALEQDKTIPESIWTESFTKEEVAEFAFVNMLGFLRNGKSDANFFCQVLGRILYRNKE